MKCTKLVKGDVNLVFCHSHIWWSLTEFQASHRVLQSFLLILKTIPQDNVLHFYRWELWSLEGQLASLVSGGLCLVAVLSGPHFPVDSRISRFPRASLPQPPSFYWRNSNNLFYILLLCKHFSLEELFWRLSFQTVAHHGYPINIFKRIMTKHL